MSMKTKVTHLGLGGNKLPVIVYLMRAQDAGLNNRLHAAQIKLSGVVRSIAHWKYQGKVSQIRATK